MNEYDPTLSHFDVDVERGRNGELFVIDICKMLAERSGTIEVKTDHRFIDTDRFYIETECRGRDGLWRPSGIMVTKAKFWSLVLGKQKPDRMLPMVITIETEWLKRAVVAAAVHKVNHISCDYGENPTRGVGVSVKFMSITAS